jgi:hypothetical protein
MADHERAAISMAADEEGAHRSAFDPVIERRIDRPGIPATALESHSTLTCFLGEICGSILPKSDSFCHCSLRLSQFRRTHAER